MAEFDIFGDFPPEPSTVLSLRASSTSPRLGGIVTFHTDLEHKLLAHVLSLHPSKTEPSSILSTIDVFCLKQYWMMHVGPSKRGILLEAVKKSVGNYLLRRRQKTPGNGDGSDEVFSILEIGTYCGYSSLMFTELVRDALASAGVEFQVSIKTLEIHPPFAAIAEKLIATADLGDIISVHTPTSGLSLFLETLLPNSIDFLFIDHDKDEYLTDLKSVIAGKVMRPGSVVCADNVVMGRIDDYLEFCRDECARGGFFSETATKMDFIEYSNEEREKGRKGLEDGVEVSLVR